MLERVQNAVLTHGGNARNDLVHVKVLNAGLVRGVLYP